MIGEKLGFPSHMSHLVRTASGEFLLEDCISFEEIEENAKWNSRVYLHFN